MIGKLKYFDKHKGWGFITAEDGRDMFFHRNNVVKGEIKDKMASTLQFDVMEEVRGSKAYNVMVLGLANDNKQLFIKPLSRRHGRHEGDKHGRLIGRKRRQVNGSNSCT